MRRLYDWTMDQAARRGALWTLAVVAFIESSVFPIPPDALLIPMILAAREKAWRFAAVCTVASVAGGFAGYGIGLFLFEAVAEPILAFYGYMDKFAEFRALYHQWGGWIVAGAGATPFPYKVITLASGVVELDLATFGIASVLSRGVRFFLVAALLWWFGPPIRRFIEANLGWVVTIGFMLLVGGFVAVKLLF